MHLISKLHSCAFVHAECFTHKVIIENWVAGHMCCLVKEMRDLGAENMRLKARLRRYGKIPQMDEGNKMKRTMENGSENKEDQELSGWTTSGMT